MKRPFRVSELLLRLVVQDSESFQGLLGDLHEEATRRPAPMRRFAHDRAVLAVARSYLVERVAGRRHSGRTTGPGRREGWARGTLADALFAARLLRRRPSYTVAVVGTLGLGFGCAIAVLSVAYGVWLKPLPFGNPDAIVRVYEVKSDPEAGSVAGDIPLRPAAIDADVARRSRLSPPLLHDLARRGWRELSHFASVSGLATDWRRDDQSRRLSGVAATRDVFDVLQLRPVEGRFFSDAPGTREVVVSEGLWRSSFGSDSAIIGRDSMILDGQAHLIVGVVADGLPYPDAAAEIWVPSDFSDDQLSEGMRGARYLDVVARLRPGAALSAAASEVDAFVQGLGKEHANHAGWGATVVPLRDDMIRPFVGILRLLVAGAVLFLLIACSNVAGLVAARRTRERDESALRLALGASRWRLLRHEILQMLWLGVGGATAAAVLAAWVLAPLQRLAPADIPRIADIRLDATVVAALTAVLLLAAAAMALAGGLLATRSRPSAGTAGGRASARSSGRATLTVVQVALTTLLLVGGAALATHFLRLAAIEPGFASAGVMTAPVVMSATSYEADADRLLFFESIIQGLERRGHVAAVGTNPPIAGTNMRFGYRAGNWEEEQAWGQYHTVSPRYFEVLGIPLVGGRVFNERDRGDATPTVIINETLANEHFDGDAVGREMIVVGTSREIVGVVGSVHHFGPDQAPPAEIYVPLAQDPWLLGHILVAPGEGFSPDVAREVAATLDPEVPVQGMFPFDQFVRTWFAPLRFQLTIIALLAGAGTLLAVVGLYALIAYVVAGRTHEIGIRVALGESARAVFHRVVGHGLGLAVAGLLVGLVAAFSLRGAAGALGIGMKVDDPSVIGVVIAIVLFATVAACIWPARRAAAVDPAVALRDS